MEQDKKAKHYRDLFAPAVSEFEFPPMDPDAPCVIEDPVTPNRAWTQMKNGADIDMLSEEEKADLYLGHDSIF